MNKEIVLIGHIGAGCTLVPKLQKEFSELIIVEKEEIPEILRDFKKPVDLPIISFVDQSGEYNSLRRTHRGNNRKYTDFRKRNKQAKKTRKNNRKK